MRHNQIPCHDEDFSGYCSGCSYVGENHGRDDIVLAHRRALRAKRIQSAYSFVGCSLIVLWPIVALGVAFYLLGRFW